MRAYENPSIHGNCILAEQCRGTNLVGMKIGLIPLAMMSETNCIDMIDKISVIGLMPNMQPLFR